MPSVNPANILREAFVVLSADELSVWSDVVTRSGRLKVAREHLIGRVQLAFGRTNDEAAAELRRTILKDVEVGQHGAQLDAALAAAQLEQMFSNDAKPTTAIGDIDIAALAVRVLSRDSAEPVSSSLIPAATYWLAQRGDSVRKVVYPTTTATKLTRADMPAVAFEPNAVSAGFASINTYLQGLVDDLDAALTALSTQTSYLRLADLLLEEQQQISWWLLSATDEGTVGWDWALTEAQQLAKLTRLLPPPTATLELFRRRAARLTWRPSPDQAVSRVSGLGRPEFRPVLDSLGRAEATERFAPEDAANAIYDELLITRAFTT